MTGKSGNTLEGLKSIQYVMLFSLTIFLRLNSEKRLPKATKAWPKVLWAFDNNSGP